MNKKRLYTDAGVDEVIYELEVDIADFVDKVIENTAMIMTELILNFML